jgi:DNA-directed RNA polymerase III subunit RPC2
MESLDFISGNEAHSNCIIFVNGQPVGLHMNRSYFIKSFRKFRREGIISAYISIYYHSIQNCIIIATDGGRLIRPLIIVENWIPLITSDHIIQLVEGKLTFDNCISKGLIEFLDVNEENDALIAITPKDVTIKSTHMEIDPLSILSCITGIIPYPHHNQSPRNVYQCAMGKQAIGVNSYNQMNRVDTLLLMQVYPQEPLVATKTIKMIHYDKLPAGQNATVAILSYSVLC